MKPFFSSRITTFFLLYITKTPTQPASSPLHQDTTANFLLNILTSSRLLCTFFFQVTFIFHSVFIHASIPVLNGT
jgi:hypothetical protein